MVDCFLYIYFAHYLKVIFYIANQNIFNKLIRVAVYLKNDCNNIFKTIECTFELNMYINSEYDKLSN